MFSQLIFQLRLPGSPEPHWAQERPGSAPVGEGRHIGCAPPPGTLSSAGEERAQSADCRASSHPGSQRWLQLTFGLPRAHTWPWSQKPHSGWEDFLHSSPSPSSSAQLSEH